GGVRLALGAASETGAPVRAPQNRRRQLAQIATAVIAAAVVTALAAWMLRPEPPTPTVSRFVYKLPKDVELRVPQLRMLDITRDGQRMVFNTSAGLYLRPLADIEGHAIPIAGGIASPTFSADGQTLGYVQVQGDVMSVSVTGGVA